MIRESQTGTAVSSFPEVLPAADFREEGVSGAGGVHYLPVPVDGEVGGQLPSIHRALNEAMAQQVHGVTRRQGGSVVAYDGHTVSDGVVPSGVCAKVVPPSAFVHVAV